jgi:hypothetical protein
MGVRGRTDLAGEIVVTDPGLPSPQSTTDVIQDRFSLLQSEMKVGLRYAKPDS